MRKNWKSFKQLEKHTKTFRIINLIIMSVLFASCVALAFYYGLVYDPNDRLISAISIAILALVPVVLEIIFGRRFNNFVFFVFEIYLIFAGFVGSVLNVYYLTSWYDIVIHILMGYIVAMCGIFVISRLNNYKKINIVLVALFCVCFSLAIEVLWEIFEWAADNLFAQTMQGEKLPGLNQPLVNDTMLDLVCNTSGAMIFFFHFIFGKTTKRSLGINFIEKQLVKENFSENISVTEENFSDNILENINQYDEVKITTKSEKLKKMKTRKKEKEVKED